MTRDEWNRRREAARKYRPKRIRCLLVTDSPPADAESYFYFENEQPHDPLWESVCEVLFEQPPRGDKIPFLKELRRRGVFLVELKPDAPREGESLSPYVAPFLINLDTWAPEKIALVGAEVYAAAYAAMKKAKWPVIDVKIPFPRERHRVEFRQKFRQALVRGGLEKLIRPLPKRAAKAEP